MCALVQVALSFFKSAVVNMSFKLDAIVCLVDAKHIMQHLTEVKADNAVNESVRQVAFSDKILVNKKDLVRSRTSFSHPKPTCAAPSFVYLDAVDVACR